MQLISIHKYFCDSWYLSLLNTESVFWKWQFFILSCLPACCLQCWGNLRSRILQQIIIIEKVHQKLTSMSKTLAVSHLLKLHRRTIKHFTKHFHLDTNKFLNKHNPQNQTGSNSNLKNSHFQEQRG